MRNPYRGEVTLVMNGVPRVMRLTLGALAELEESMSADSLLNLVDRFETGKYSSRDVIALLVAGLRGGGWTGSVDHLQSAVIEGGAGRAVQAAAELLVCAFSVPAKAT